MKVDTLPDIQKSAPKNISIVRIIELRLKGLSVTEIGHILNCSKSNVSERLRTINFDSDELAAYKDKRADIQAFVQSKITEKQIEYLASEKSKIESWNDYKSAQISKATEQDKEQIIINLKGDQTVNFQTLINMERDIKSRVSEPIGVNNIDTNDSDIDTD